MTAAKTYKLTLCVEVSVGGFDPDAEELQRYLQRYDDGRHHFPSELIADGIRRAVEYQMTRVVRERDGGWVHVNMTCAKARLEERGEPKTICHACGAFGYTGDATCEECGETTNETL